MKLAYFVSEYPKRSHTFIRREIEAIEAMGIPITVLSIRKPSAGEILNDQDQSDFDRTWSIIPISILRLIYVHLSAVLMSPVRYFKSLFVAVRHRVPGFRSLLYSFIYFTESIILANKLASEKITHVHVHFANVGATIMMIASKYTGISWSMTLHGTVDYEYPHGILLGKKIESAKFTGCISNFGRAQALRTVNHSHWNKLFIYRCGINVDSLPATGSRSDDETTIICIARMSSEKGLMGLVSACSKLKTISNIRMILIGDGPDRDDIETAIVEFGLQDMFTLTGYLSEKEVLKYLANADVLAVPSLMEGIPVVLMEAMAMNVSVVAPRLSGIPELIDDQHDGLLYTPADWDDFQEKMRLLISDDELRKKLQSNATQKINSQFSFGECVKPLYQQFTKLT